MPELQLPGHHALLVALGGMGMATSAQLQAALGASQPTVSRLLDGLSSQVLTLGRGKRTRYALPQSILGQAARQPLWWVDEDGRMQRLGELSLLQGGRVHVQADGQEWLTQGALPWLLSPLRAQGFLGRLLAQRLARHGLDANPDRWAPEQTLFAALGLHDPPGAIVVGEPPPSSDARLHKAVPAAAPGAALDSLAADVATTLPAGSSAGGEQAKFTCVLDDGTHALVKFTPPRGTPFGQRWHDLLHAEALALEVLALHGVPVAAARVVETNARSYLVSPRFDRIGAKGRRHVVALDAVHDAFVPGARRHWAATCEALAAQRRIAAQAGAQAQALLDFGRLIGNSDMHFGNLSLFVARADLARGRFALAPAYDMLPMRWRPDPLSGGFDDAPFDPEPAALDSAARVPALAFWQRMAAHAPLSASFRRLGGAMARRLAVR